MWDDGMSCRLVSGLTKNTHDLRVTCAWPRLMLRCLPPLLKERDPFPPGPIINPPCLDVPQCDPGRGLTGLSLQPVLELCTYFQTFHESFFKSWAQFLQK